MFCVSLEFNHFQLEERIRTCDWAIGGRWHGWCPSCRAGESLHLARKKNADGEIFEIFYTDDVPAAELVSKWLKRTDGIKVRASTLSFCSFVASSWGFRIFAWIEKPKTYLTKRFNVDLEKKEKGASCRYFAFWRKSKQDNLGRRWQVNPANNKIVFTPKKKCFG